MVLIWLGCVSVVFLVGLVLLVASEDHEVEDPEAAAERYREACRQRTRERLEDEAAERRRIAEAERAREAAEAVAKQAVTAARRADFLKRSLVGAGGESLEAVDEFLRCAGLLHEHLGEVASARFVGSPTGRVLLEWNVDADEPLAPRVCGRRNGKVIFVEHAYRGRFPDKLRRGTRYVYSIEVVLRGTKEVRELSFEARVPTAAEWAREVTPTERKTDGEARLKEKMRDYARGEGFWEALRARLIATVKEKNLSPDDEDREVSKIEAWVAAERERTEYGG